MLKFAIATSALVAAGTTAYLVHASRSERPRASASAPALQYGSGRLGLAHAPSLGPSKAPLALRSRSVAEADLAYLPADSDAVVGLNFAEIRQSALWQRFVAPSLADVDGIREFEALCGFDPLASLGSISLGLRGFGGEGNVSGVIVIHGFERAKAMSCFDSAGVAEAEKEGSRITIDGDVVLITDTAGSDHLAFTFLDDTSALIVIGPDAATRQGVERVAAGNDGLHSSSRFADTLQVLNTDASLWLMLADTSPLVAAIKIAMEPHTSIQLGSLYLSVTVTDTLALDAGVRLGSPETVAKLVSAIQTNMSKHDVAHAVARHFDQLDVMADGSDLIVSIAMSGDQIVQLIASIASRSEASSTVTVTRAR